MAPAASAERIALYRGLDLRRSKRTRHAVRLMILGQDREGQPYREKMSTVNLSLHGCCYQSWHNSQVGAKVELQVTEGLLERSALVRARVRYVRPPAGHSELFQIGVEFDSPQSEWLSAQEEVIGGTAPRLAPARKPGGTAATTESMLSAAPPAELTPQERAVVERVTVTTDRLIAALRAPVQRVPENAVEAAGKQLEETLKRSIQREIATQLDEAVRHALWMIDEINSANARKTESFLQQRLEQMIRSSEEGVFRQLEARFNELCAQWRDQQEQQQRLSEEPVVPPENSSAESQRDLNAAKELAAAISSGGQGLSDTLNGPNRCDVADFEAAQVAARRIEAPALRQEASDALEQFRRQLDLQASSAVSEMKQGLSSSLAALEAEHQARRRLFEEDLAQATERAAEQFRSGIRAHLYASLAAAIEAVDKQATSALAAVLKGPA